MASKLARAGTCCLLFFLLAAAMLCAPQLYGLITCIACVPPIPDTFLKINKMRGDREALAFRGVPNPHATFFRPGVL